MKLYAWAIIGFRRDEAGNVSWGQYVYYTWIPGEGHLALVGEIDKKAKLHFPKADGWFDVSHNICEIPNVTAATDTPTAPTA